MPTALTRPLPSTLAACQLTHIARVPIDLARAREQHAAYERALEGAGWAVVRIAAADELPDSVFVEDAAVVFDELAIITRPGAVSRRGEVAGVAEALAPLRELRFIEAPATVDGGDVLRVGRDVYVGLSTRTNAAAIEQMSAILGGYGYRVQAVEVAGVLHLKSAATEAAVGVVLVNPEWVDPRLFPAAIEVDPDEPQGANVLRAGDVLFAAAAFPRTNARLRAAGLHVRELEADELAKAEGALTCCSLLVT
jgi:dimethylargininase